MIGIETVISKLKEAVVLDFATVDGDGNPQVRNVSAIHYEGTDIYFLTARGKPFARQLMANGRLQILGYTDSKETIRVSGIAEHVPDDEQERWISVIYGEQPYLSNVYPGKTKNIDIMFRLTDYTVEYFCLSTRPITRGCLEIGSAHLKPKGYEITDGCVACGTCIEWCPQSAIDEGDRYLIRKENCLQCGNCYEHCPVSAVRFLG